MTDMEPVDFLVASAVTKGAISRLRPYDVLQNYTAEITKPLYRAEKHHCTFLTQQQNKFTTFHAAKPQFTNVTCIKNDLDGMLHNG